jgi:hypothetical protein
MQERNRNMKVDRHDRGRVCRIQVLERGVHQTRAIRMETITSILLELMGLYGIRLEHNGSGGELKIHALGLGD